MSKLQTVMAAVVLVFAAALVAVPAGAHPWGGYQKDECSGEAPILALCTTGSHFRFHDDSTFRHGFTGAVSDDYTGTVESSLVYLGGERVFRCDYDGGALVEDSCGGSGEFPPVQNYFVQVCRSYDMGTSTLGGSGAWGCFMEHG